MAITTTGKVLLWVAGGVFALGCGGVIVLYGAASLAMWKNSQEMDKEAARQEAAYKAMTPEQHLAQAKAALEQEGNASLCLAFLEAVPEGTPGRAELVEAATRKQTADDKAETAFRALTPEQHLAAAKTALEAGDVPTCKGHLMWVPRTTPGCAALVEAAAQKEKAMPPEDGR